MRRPCDSFVDMKTIAVTIDSRTLAIIDRMATRSVGGRPAGRRAGKRPNRSELVRIALQEFVARHQQLDREARDRAILAKHRALLARQAEALVAEQAEL
jgi:metal-responsive CopG/Arc/MetJ family transcriptional regulator